VRVTQTVSGANWVAAFIPRQGQEVLVQSIAGNGHRPVVLYVVYNGQDRLDAHGREVSGGVGQGQTTQPTLIA
jgi:type VI secretion system secreted protein VgrG